VKIQLLAPGNEELDEAHDYYEEHLPGLGDEYLKEIPSTFSRIKSNPVSQIPIFYIAIHMA
jgi:hypothetical protein